MGAGASKTLHSTYRTRVPMLEAVYVSPTVTACTPHWHENPREYLRPRICLHSGQCWTWPVPSRAPGSLTCQMMQSHAQDECMLCARPRPDAAHRNPVIAGGGCCWSRSEHWTPGSLLVPVIAGCGLGAYKSRVLAHSHQCWSYIGSTWYVPRSLQAPVSPEVGQSM